MQTLYEIRLHILFIIYTIKNNIFGCIQEIKRLRPDESSPTRIKLTIFDGVISLSKDYSFPVFNYHFIIS